MSCIHPKESRSYEFCIGCKNKDICNKSGELNATKEDKPNKNIRENDIELTDGENDNTKKDV